MEFLNELLEIVDDEYDELQDPALANGECYLTSSAILSLTNWDERAELLRASHCNDAVERYQSLGQASDHYAVYLPGEGTVLDYTLRQFNPATTFPFVGTVMEWLQILGTAWESADVDLEYNPN